MRATVRLPDAGVWVRRGPLALSDARTLVMRYRLELLWAAFAVANYAAMLVWPTWGTVPFYLTWISLTLLYGIRVWPLGPTLVVLVATLMLTGLPHIDQVIDGHQAAEKLARVPLMALLFLTVVWHARRRVDAQRIAEGRAEQSRSMLERQERFMHDASHELRTPVTIARGHLELLLGNGSDAELDIALDELGRIDAIIDRLLLLATADQPDFLQVERRRDRAVPRGRVHSLVRGGSAGMAARPASAGYGRGRPRPAAGGARRARRERDQVHAQGATRSSCGRPATARGSC